MASDRTDGVAAKLRLLETAHQDGRHDLAMSLAESIKDTLSFERQDEFGPGPLHLGIDDVRKVAELPSPGWRKWARGWAFCHEITVFETVGIDRQREPVHVRFAAAPQQLLDPSREIRVAQVEPKGELSEIPSQLLKHVRSKVDHRCEVVFQTDVAMHESAVFLIFFGNPNAELPDYQTDLEVRGEGYALDIENGFFEAKLSHQMGQLTRLNYKREHGLELYAGGKGHGEPPTIDWSNDYVDAGGFQKLRMRAWGECPNWSVVRGPVCAQIRRWGFPHSPVHPLYAPSRMHMDQTYTFYAGLPHFFKHGEMEAVTELEISAMRDDEWVFSGYSFDQQLWLDRQGIVHEGKPTGDDANDLWGVGFYHTKSRDALVALWLKHEADNYDDIQHNGSPTLHYDGHGQLWARYPARGTTLDAGAVFRQRNAYLAIDYPKESGSADVASLRHQLVNPLEVRKEDIPAWDGAVVLGQLARPGESPEATPLKQAIWAVLREIRDEQLYKVDANVVDMGYIYDLRIEDGVVHILLTMPHRGRPVYDFLITGGGGRVDEGIHERLSRIGGIRDVVIDFTWEPAWDINRVSLECRERLGLD